VRAHSVGHSQALELFEDYLHDFLTRQVSGDPVARQIAYHFAYDAPPPARRGKRLRPKLVIAAAASFGCPLERTLAACAAIELLHNYSLVHDDIEDSDRLRHGRETVWAAYGIPHGINAGDAIGALAQLALLPLGNSVPAQTAFDMSMDVAQANLRMCEGQSLDLALEYGAGGGIAKYLEMIEGKTAALFGCAAVLGARCATVNIESEIDRTRDIGRLFGLGFQIRDDILGIWGQTGDTGKVAAGDIERRKKTFPVLWALEHDPKGAGLAIRQAFEGPEGPSAAAVDRLRGLLESCGSYAAARAAADNYFDSAWKLAQGMQPLSDFVLQNRT
jgi:geranylgeranyl diphosphate synthase, type I